ncbi:ROK family protein [Fibrella aestuarina BUZ 2]|uniref:ROK family protein n=1 Tax=Fibrella aestuarina BUZ 2 TaxID=1166018 RepID=I0K9D8_9BACT|nr:ROK family protein [Fibrella aestuarina]CCH00741.1 ROK family protein [Fibrella aestuarina BUZ 2]
MQIGIEIGGTKLQLLVAGADGTIVRRFQQQVDSAAGAAGILDWIEQTLGQVPGPIDGVGVGFGGPIDAETGYIITSHQVAGWAGINLADWLRQRTGAAQVRLENDANAAALGEALHGAGQGFTQVFYVTLGSGVGGGMVVDGKLYRGAKPGEAEIGHLWIVPPTRDSPGQTLEQTASGWAVDRQIRDLLPQLPPDSPLRWYVEMAPRSGGEARYLAPALADNDPVAAMLIEQIGAVVALGLSHVVHLFHPQVLVLGGGLSLIGEPLRMAVETALSRFIMAAFQPPPAVRLAQLGTDAVPVGALAMMKD